MYITIKKMVIKMATTKIWAIKDSLSRVVNYAKNLENGVRIDIWTHLMRGCIMNYVH